ncbi:MAG: AAA family ATPase [Succinatimonas sp.]|jgi:hypothetical protein|nr:AAA family ATPase [Succinatimonas sp.]
MSDDVAESIGIEDFAKLSSSPSAYYVDKTKFLKKILGKETSVFLFTRPRRFGKSLTISMIENFVGMNYKNPRNKSKSISLFKDLEIYKDQEFIQKYLGEFPVISLSLKGVSSLDSIDEAIFNLGEKLSHLAECIEDLISNNKRGILKYFRALDPRFSFAKIRLNQIKCINTRYYTLNDKIAIIKNALYNISMVLSRTVGRKVIILVDEYDVPLAKTASTDFYIKLKDAYSEMLSNALKTNRFLEVGILTGCLQVAKESIFTGFNNFQSIDFNDPVFSSFFGFTEDEVLKMLKFYNLEDKYDVFKQWYDGYNFGHDHIFCPWDVIKYIRALTADINTKPEPYWVNTGSLDLLQDIYKRDPVAYAEDFQKLIDGQSIEVTIEKNLNYQLLCSNEDENYFWNLMYITGYLTIDTELSKDDKTFLKIPNRSVHGAILNLLKWCFSNKNLDFKSKTSPILKIISQGDDKALQATLNNLMLRYVNTRDISSDGPKEYFYQGFLDGLFSQVCDSKQYYYKSNLSLGDGFADISFIIPQEDISKQSSGVIIEIKAAKDIRELEVQAEAALSQIHAKNYDKGQEDFFDLSEIIAVGLAFYKKKCLVKIEKFKL